MRPLNESFEPSSERGKSDNTALTHAVNTMPVGASITIARPIEDYEVTLKHGGHTFTGAHAVWQTAFNLAIDTIDTCLEDENDNAS